MTRSIGINRAEKVLERLYSKKRLFGAGMALVWGREGHAEQSYSCSWSSVECGSHAGEWGPLFSR